MIDATGFKLVTLGEGRVGKTSLIQSFAGDGFSERQESTINANFITKHIAAEQRTGRFFIWDTAGQEKYRALAPIYYRNAVGALIVYDITDRASFDRVAIWVRELQSIAGASMAIVIAGNKCDLETARQVSVEEASRYANSVGAAHFLTSAKTSRGVSAVFSELAKRVLKTQQAAPPEHQSRRLEVVRTQSRKRKACC